MVLSLFAVLPVTSSAALIASGEIVETTTEPIPATGEPDEPSGSDNACPWCGETHPHTLAGWWTELIHHILYILRTILFWFV